MRVFITYTHREAYTAALKLLGDIWECGEKEYPGTTIHQAYNLIELFTTNKVII